MEAKTKQLLLTSPLICICIISINKVHTTQHNIHIWTVNTYIPHTGCPVFLARSVCTYLVYISNNRWFWTRILNGTPLCICPLSNLNRLTITRALFWQPPSSVLWIQAMSAGISRGEGHRKWKTENRKLESWNNGGWRKGYGRKLGKTGTGVSKLT